MARRGLLVGVERISRLILARKRCIGIVGKGRAANAREELLSLERVVYFSGLPKKRLSFFHKPILILGWASKNPMIIGMYGFEVGLGCALRQTHALFGHVQAPERERVCVKKSWEDPKARLYFQAETKAL